MTTVMDPEVKRQHDAIDQAAAQQKATQARIKQLTKAVTDAEQCSVEFETKKSFFIERKRLLQSQLPTFWGKVRGDLSTQLNFDPLLGIVESHGTILAIDAALADAPRVKQHLDEQLRVAKKNLADHEPRTPTK